MTDFATIHEAALMRHGQAALAARLPSPASAEQLRALPEDRYLSQMSLRIFRAGLKHELVDSKWPAFEEVLAERPAIAEHFSATLARRHTELEAQREGLSAALRARREADRRSQILGRVRVLFRIT